MKYGAVAARNRMGLTARAYRVLHEWTRQHVPNFSAAHEDMTWTLVAPATAEQLLAIPECGQKTADEIAAAMRRQGLTLHGHEAVLEPMTLARGSRVFLAGRSRPLVVVDVGRIGGDVLLRLRGDAGQAAEPSPDEEHAPLAGQVGSR